VPRPSGARTPALQIQKGYSGLFDEKRQTLKASPSVTLGDVSIEKEEFSRSLSS